MRGSTRKITPFWFPAARTRGSGVPLAGILCTRYSRTVLPAGGVQLSVYVPGCGPVDTTWRLVGPGKLGVLVPVGVAVAVIRAAAALEAAAGTGGVGRRADPPCVVVCGAVGGGGPPGSPARSAAP